MIRSATRQDIPALLAHGLAMHSESRYRILPWDNDKVAGLIDWLIDSPDGLAVVAENDGRIVGGMLGSVDAHYFSQSMIAQEYAVFIEPGLRGSLMGVLLYKHYTDWAQSRGAVLIQVGVTAGIANDKVGAMLRTLGYGEVGQLYEFKGKPNE